MRLLGEVKAFFVKSKQKKTFLCALKASKKEEKYISKQKRQHFYTLKNVYEEQGHLFSCLHFMLLKSVCKKLFACFSCFLKASKNWLLAFNVIYEWRFVYFLCYLWVKVACLLFKLFMSEGLFTFYVIYE